jgi:hypothetical protein
MVFYQSFQPTCFTLFCGDEAMPYSAGDSLPEYRAKASINPASNNKIQDDEYARRYGFHAGLTPGISLFAYMSRPLIESMGRAWLEHGSADMRFVRPVYEGEEIRVTGAVSSVAPDGALSVACQAVNNQGAVCGIGSAQLPSQLRSSAPALADYPRGRARLHRPISLESLQPGEILAPVTSEFTWNVHWQYCQKSIRDHHPIYQKAPHPGWVLSQASHILEANYAVPAWIDVSSQVQNFHCLEEEGQIATRGRVQAKFERNGDHFIVLSLAVFAQELCLQTISYTAIFRIAPNAA